MDSAPSAAYGQEENTHQKELKGTRTQAKSSGRNSVK
jgi:hypothetical protein